MAANSDDRPPFDPHPGTTVRLCPDSAALPHNGAVNEADAKCLLHTLKDLVHCIVAQVDRTE
jgi:hypothetical protein